MKYLSLFSGIGGFELGIQQAYEKLRIKNEEQGVQGVGNKKRQRSQRTNFRTDGLTCIGYSEIDKYAIQIYQKHFPNHKNYGDITEIKAEELPDFDLLVGGFPCQAFSIAGKRKGFKDTRGTLFFEIARIIRQKQPRLLLLENVKGLLSHNKGDTFLTIIQSLDELGYDLQWQVLNSKNHGVPQNRERVFIIGHLRGTSRPEVFPLYESGEEHTAKTDKQGCASTLTGRSAGGQNRRGNYIVQLNEPVHSNNRIYSPEGVSPTLNTMQGGARQPFIASSGDGAIENKKVDTKGVRETSGIPRHLDEISDTQRYKTLGNAVTVNVIRDIMEKLL